VAPTQGTKYEIPSEMRDFAEKSVDQARKAFDGFLGAAHKAVDTLQGSTSTMQSSASDATRKTLSFAEQNIAAAFDHAQKLVRAKDLQEAMQIQSEFARAQFASLQTQMKELGEHAQEAARTAANHATNAASQAAETARGAAERATSMMRDGANQGASMANRTADTMNRTDV
jgi:phasin